MTAYDIKMAFINDLAVSRFLVRNPFHIDLRALHAAIMAMAIMT